MRGRSSTRTRLTQVALWHGTALQSFYEEEIMKCYSQEECYGGPFSGCERLLHVCCCVVSIRTERPSKSGVLFFEELSVCVAAVAIGDGFVVFLGAVSFLYRHRRNRSSKTEENRHKTPRSIDRVKPTVLVLCYFTRCPCSASSVENLLFRLLARSFSSVNPSGINLLFVTNSTSTEDDPATGLRRAKGSKRMTIL